MNLLEHIVKTIESKPYFLYGKWWVNVKAECYGVESRHSIMCESEENAIKIDVGHKFLA